MTMPGACPHCDSHTEATGPDGKYRLCPSCGWDGSPDPDEYSDLHDVADAKQYRLVEEDGRLLIYLGWMLIAELNEDRDGYVDPAVGRLQWEVALVRGKIMVDALNAPAAFTRRRP